MTKEFKFNDIDAFSYLIDQGHVYTLRSKEFRNIFRLASKYLKPQNKVIGLKVHCVEVIAITKDMENDVIMPYSKSDSEKLEQYINESGFSNVDLWLEALKQWRYRWKHLKPKTFYIHKAEVM